ncbi:MAG: lipase family protein [Nitrosomonas sp.]|nr:lipase family protein [Nitrosomonas sp.]
MSQRSIIFVPGKNPKPPADQHRELLWRTLLEGVRRADASVADHLSGRVTSFKFIAWNYLYYQKSKDVIHDLPWIDALINQHGPTAQDIEEAKSWHIKWDRLLYNIVDHLPFLLQLLPEELRSTAKETKRYFQNEGNIASEIRELLKQELRPILANNDKVLLIGHSLGSVIAYDTLWELSHLERLSGKIDLFLTIGSPLGMNYVQRRLMGHDKTGVNKYPTNIKRWENISSVGDVTALDRVFSDDFSPMLDFGVVESIEDHCDGIYNFFRNEAGLNCHRSYGYLVNPAVGKVIADWWQSHAP